MPLAAELDLCPSSDNYHDPSFGHFETPFSGVVRVSRNDEREFEGTASLHYPLNEMNSTGVQKFAGETMNLLISKAFDWVNWNLQASPRASFTEACQSPLINHCPNGNVTMITQFRGDCYPSMLPCYLNQEFDKLCGGSDGHGASPLVPIAIAAVTALTAFCIAKCLWKAAWYKIRTSCFSPSESENLPPRDAYRENYERAAAAGEVDLYGAPVQIYTQ
ncbi:MAG: FZ domain-containing protein [Candidatus Midichloria mitochondrii]|nr:hypothetical protein [Candidatus Midichloria mitochondrii]MDJ1288478.1 hypothetical protein [Candidatus Midichloria mitochondrii]MDJ1299004.1 hypothetical protein [Candidatus Midichloria mitochondrii]MDJ1313167.1 hypothetical protein [Candidatus Midichloria mitochondrii]